MLGAYPADGLHKGTTNPALAARRKPVVLVILPAGAKLLIPVPGTIGATAIGIDVPFIQISDCRARRLKLNRAGVPSGPCRLPGSAAFRVLTPSLHRDPCADASPKRATRTAWGSGS